MNALLTPLADRLRELNPKSDLSVLEQAFDKAKLAHDGQLRKSGDPYITHPVAVAEILADLGLDTNTLAAALLHDTMKTPNIQALNCVETLEKRLPIL